MTITNVGILSQAIYMVEPDLKLLIRAGLTNRSYAHVNRIENDMRLFYEEKRFDFGFKLKLEQRHFIWPNGRILLRSKNI